MFSLTIALMGSCTSTVETEEKQEVETTETSAMEENPESDFSVAPQQNTLQKATDGASAENELPEEKAEPEQRKPTQEKLPNKAKAVKVKQPTPPSPSTTLPKKQDEMEQQENAKPKTPEDPVEQAINEQPNTSVTPEPAKAPQPPSHESWNQLLEQYVSAAGSVNYQGLKRNKEKLTDYLAELAENPVRDDWSRGEKMAYWINAYNAFTVKLIVDNYPVSSITDLHGGKPWDVKWIELGNKTYTLNEIEHDILRPTYQDARIHFAVNCAAQSCPPLLNKAWTASNLERYLDRQADKFINSERFNQISSNAVAISKIFEWYAEDFGNIIKYLNKYSDTKINPGAEVTYQAYNWGLNE